MSGCGLALTGEDAIRLHSWCSVAGVTLALEARLLSDDGLLIPMADTHAPTSDRSEHVTIHQLNDGLLTHLQVRVSSGAAKHGQCFVLAELVRGQLGAVQPLGTILSDYVATGTRAGWPGSPLRAPTEGPGCLRLIFGTDPAAGAEIIETVPTGARWRLQAFSFGLLASAAAANRFSLLSIDDGLNLAYQTSANTALTAGLLGIYRGGAGVPLTTVGAQHFDLPLPEELVLPAGARIRTTTTALQAGDDYTAPVYLVEEWIEP